LDKQFSSKRFTEELTISEESLRTKDAKILLDELSETLKSITGSSGRSSFDPKDVEVSRGVFVVARNKAGEAVGCGGFRPVDENVAEVKRMYAKNTFQGIGTQVLSNLEKRAQELGYSAICLETRLVNKRAVLFYEKRGYQRTENYGKYVNNPEAVCFKKYLTFV